MRGEGFYFKRAHGGWTIRYSLNGRDTMESVAKLIGKAPGAVTEEDAKRALRTRFRQRCAGTYVGPQNERITFSELVKSYVIDLQVRGKRSARGARYHLQRVSGELGPNLRIAAITADTLKA